MTPIENIEESDMRRSLSINFLNRSRETREADEDIESVLQILRKSEYGAVITFSEDSTWDEKNTFRSKLLSEARERGIIIQTREQETGKIDVRIKPRDFNETDWY